jgi:hypothetical protein
LAKLLERETEHFETLSQTKIGPFQKFVFPLIRRSYPSLIGGEPPRPGDTPLKKLVDQALAEHHPDDPDWEEWKEDVEKRIGDLAVRNLKKELDEETEEMTPELRAELDNLRCFEPPPPSSAPLVSVQPMPSPVGGIAFYRPRYATPRGEIDTEPQRRGDTGRSGRKKPRVRFGKPQRKFTR